MKRKMMIALLMAGSLCTVSVPVMAEETTEVQESADAENCDNAVMDVISEYLAHTGLMFKGWSRKWDKEVST